ncbi:S8 family peptidase [Methyloglobulus sp.]|uniref:S8 family peptidase n=1 Tax=Methyloglobulus sp. TaxID=2518622 RepID=UPI00398A4EE3
MGSNINQPDAMSGDEVQTRIQHILVKTYIALPLLNKMEELPPDSEYNIIIDAHLDFPGARPAARKWILKTLVYLLGTDLKDPRLKPGKNEDQPHYVFARLTADAIKKLIELDGLHNDELMQRELEGQTSEKPGARSGAKIPTKTIPPANKKGKAEWVHRAVYQIWEDFRVFPLITTSIATVKADAARTAFKAGGRNIVWAIIDSGIDAEHAHFRKNGNLEGDHAQWHRDFTSDNLSNRNGSAIKDEYGHGSHVAGIIAGEIIEPNAPKSKSKSKDSPFQNEDIRAYRRILSPSSTADRREVTTSALPLQAISGMAPQTRLVSLKVLNADGSGEVSSIISALNWIQEINGYGRRIQIHGVNLSVGYPFDAEWFACGQSQLCVEVDRLVRSGVVVVVAAGNRGYGQLASTQQEENRMGGLVLSISDPGNAELAVTVGSTHREMPHVYGVSYFSGKGPTGDGRLKPDLIAPGEKIISCGVGKLLEQNLPDDAKAIAPNYIEFSGTSMAAPHVSGCIASFLSVKREFIGRPDRVKEIFLASATDLGRERSFQGAGLVDLMRAIQYI